MKSNYIIFLLIIHFSLGAQKHTRKPFKTRMQRIEIIKKDLARFDNCFCKDKFDEVVESAIKSGFHPDKLDFEVRGLKRTPLLSAIEDDDFELVELLLENGADPCALDLQWSKPRPLIVNARSIGMAQLLVKYGASRVIEKHGVELLNNMWWDGKQPELIPYFVSLGANPNKKHRGELPLFTLVRNMPWHHDLERNEIKKFMSCVKLFLQEGALIYNGDSHNSSIAQILNRRQEDILKEYRNHKDILENMTQSHSALRQILIDAQQYRDQGLFIRINQSVECFSPKLSKLVVSFIGSQEKRTYEEIERSANA